MFYFSSAAGNIRKLLSLFVVICVFSIAVADATQASGVKAQPTIKNVQTGVIQCDQDNTASKPAPTCELSASVRINEKLIVFANDQLIAETEKSSLFSLGFTHEKNTFKLGSEKKFLKQRVFRDAMKYESLTITPDGKWVIAATAFDRYNKDHPEQSHYNTLLAWNASLQTEDADINSIVLSSGPGLDYGNPLFLRNRFLEVLNRQQPKEDSLKYFKIEGLAAIPDNNANNGKLLFGIHEEGEDAKNNLPSLKIIVVPYSVTDQFIKLNVDDKFKLVDIKGKLDTANLAHNTALGISSMEYDKDTKRLYILTSFEESNRPEGLGGYLWVVPIDNFDKKGTPPFLPVQKDGQAYVFDKHKPEGLAVLNNNHILVVFDDEKITTQVQDESALPWKNRELNESVYQIIELK